MIFHAVNILVTSFFKHLLTDIDQYQIREQAVKQSLTTVSATLRVTEV